MSSARKKSTSILTRLALHQKPAISVGICAYNEARNIGRLLSNLLENEEISEIIVVASGCTDGTEAVVQKRKSKKITLIVEHNRLGKASALNRILATFKGDLLVLVSADVLPAPRCLSRLVRPLMRDNRIAMSCGRPVPTNDNRGLLGYMVHMFWRLHHRAHALLDRYDMNTHGGEIIALRRGIITLVPEDVVCDDGYAGVTTWKKGLIVRYCPDAIVYIKAPTTLRELFLQRRKIVYGHHKVKKATSEYPRVPDTMPFFSPLTLIKLLSEEFRESPRDIIKFLASVTFEILVNLVAVADLMIGNSHKVWKIAHSTKAP